MSAGAIPVSELGLNSSEARYLQQQIAASQQGSNSSRAASHASSQGRLLLDPTSLQALSAHFDRLMYSIQQRWHYVSLSLFILSFLPAFKVVISCQ